MEFLGLTPEAQAFVRAYFDELFRDAKELDSRFLSGYAQVMIDSANLRSAVRTLRMHKDADFLRTALIPGGSVSPERLVMSSVSGEGLAVLFAKRCSRGQRAGQRAVPKARRRPRTASAAAACLR